MKHFSWICTLPLCLLLSCAKVDVTVPRAPLNEAYRLMDKGDNAKAIYLLEGYLQKYPSDKEARILAASAYMGEAGIDIYRSYDSFKDILFSLPLGERLGKGPSTSAEDPSVTGAPLEQVIGYLDLVLGKTKHVVSFLSRFPKVKKEDWPLLDRALEHMEVDDPKHDERLYRSFVRVVYLKAFLDEEVLADSEFGSLKWVCRANFLSLRDSAIWTLKHLFAVTEDFKEVFPSNEGELSVLHKGLKSVLTAIDTKSPSGMKTVILGFEQTVKEHLKCNSISN